MSDLEKFRVDFASRLFDGEVRRKDMIETKAYFQATVTGILMTAGIFRYHNVSEFQKTWKLIFDSGPSLRILGSLLFLVFFVLLFSIAQALRTRRWHNGVPSKIEELLVQSSGTMGMPSLSVILADHLVKGYTVNKTVNRQKSRWVAVATVCLFLVIVIIAAINVQVLVNSDGK
jgi:hypothetical protein